MKLLLKERPSPERLKVIRATLDDAWEVIPVEAEAAWQAALPEATALVSMSYGQSLAAAISLRLLQIPGAGFDRVDFAALPEQCTVCNVFEHEIPMAEYIVLAMLEWQIRLSRMHAAMRGGRWNDGVIHPEPFHGELFGKTIGFVGYGHIAQEAASRLRTFGVRQVACTRSPEKGGEHLEAVWGMDELPRLLEMSHFVVLACPLTEQTRGLIGAPQLAAMRPDAVLINVARAGVTDEAALFAACRSHRIAGAVIDVWSSYPRAPEDITWPSEHPFQTLDNVLMTPHASGWSDGLWDRRWNAMCANLNRLARGEPLRNVIREPGGPRPV